MSLHFIQGRDRMSKNRRRSERHAVGFYVDQFVNDEPFRCFTTDLSSIGMYMERPVQAINRSSKFVQVEIKLPRSSDSIWTLGEVIYDRLDSIFHGTAVCFTAMARTHRRRLCEWLHESNRTERFVSTGSIAIHRPPPAYLLS
jgi:hypothetical protein